MSAPSELPEGLPRYLLERLLPKDLKGEAIQSDLLEEFRVRAERSSHREARAWYRRQSRRILWAIALGRISRAERKAGVRVGRASMGSVLGSITDDTSYALRRFRKSPGYATIAIATIAIGVGANTAIFSVLDAVILNPLPFPESDRLIQIWETNPEFIAELNRPYTDVPLTLLNFSEYAEQNRTLITVRSRSAVETVPRNWSRQGVYHRPFSRSSG